MAAGCIAQANARKRYAPRQRQITTKAMDWYAIKVSITEATGLDRDALHLLSGLFAQLLLALLLRRRLSAWLPWILILVASAANEWFDLSYEVWPDRSTQWNESFKDMATTMALPTLLLLIGRFAPHLLVQKRCADMNGPGAAG